MSFLAPHLAHWGPWLGRSSRVFFEKGLGRRGKGPEKVHVEPVTNQTPDALDLEALSLRDIVYVGAASRSTLQSIVIIKVGTLARVFVENPRTRSSL